MSSDLKQFGKGVGSGYVFMVLSLLVSLFLAPFALKYLSRAEYGVFAVATDLLGWLSIANLGVTAVLNPKAAQLIGKQDIDELNIVVSTTFFAQLWSVAFIFLVGLLLSNHPDWLFGQESGVEDLSMLIGILIAGYGVSYAVQPLNALLIADKQVHIDYYLQIGLLAIRTVITVFLLTQGFKLLALAISSFTSTVIITIITWIRVKVTLKQVEIKRKHWRKSRFYYLLKNGLWFTLGGIAGILILRMDSFLIGKYISLDTVASFVITVKLYQVADIFHQQFFNALRPYFAQLYGRGAMDKVGRLYQLSFNGAHLAAFAMGVTIYLLNAWFIQWWVGPGFFLGDTLNLLLCIHFILQASVLPNRILLVTTLYANAWHNLTRIAEGIAKLSLSILFIHLFGINTLLVAGIFASLVFSNLGLNLLASLLLKTSFHRRLLLIFYTFSLLLLALSPDFWYKATVAILLLSALLWFNYPQLVQYLEILRPLLFKKEARALHSKP